MYHDQGHGPVKVLGIDAGVNIIVGLPVIRTSLHGVSDHAQTRLKELVVRRWPGRLRPGGLLQARPPAVPRVGAAGFAMDCRSSGMRGYRLRWLRFRPRNLSKTKPVDRRVWCTRFGRWTPAGAYLYRRLLRAAC
jgi:hypothetical protein